MKTSKRKRSTKSDPVEALDSAPAAAASAEPAPLEMVATEPANEPVVIEAAVESEPVVAESSESLAADASEPVAAESSESLAADASEPVAAESSESLAADASEPVVAESNEFVVAETSEPVAAEASEPVVVEAQPAATSAEPVIVLAANCSVKDAAALKSSLCAVANESAAVTLDTSAVERVDTATMQLLCAFVRDRSARNQSIVWRGQSQALHDAVRLLGVGALLGFDQATGVAA